MLDAHFVACNQRNLAIFVHSGLGDICSDVENYMINIDR
jgi:hypothetical protein